MGQAMSGLTQYDVEELIAASGNKFTQDEIETLYSRFRILDRSSKGYISSEELLSIPELSINPLTRRLERLFDSVNFKEFVEILAPFSARASHEDKVRFIFTVYDMDGDGAVSREDLELILRQLAGTSFSDEQVKEAVQQALQEAGRADAGELTLPDFEKALKTADLSAMKVDIPHSF
mmetsp:Transcript_14457/g.43727  ORF Transcript_14457/g.43727 Transcript_14457/m.43727 type:complete len:178 (-) Transcript_14457:4154-4687(-)